MLSGSNHIISIRKITVDNYQKTPPRRGFLFSVGLSVFVLINFIDAADIAFAKCAFLGFLQITVAIHRQSPISW